MLGIAVVFSGFIVLGVFGGNYQGLNIETDEFGNCFEYSNNEEPIEIDCSEKVLSQSIFFGIVVALIVAGVIFLAKGIKGDWDNKVRPEDMVGPGRDNRDDGNDSKGNQ